MYHENEIVMLFLCVGVLIFIYFNRKNLVKFKGWRPIFVSFVLLLIACISTVVEGFMLEGFFNYLEHSCYAGSGLMLAAWCYRVFKENSRL